MHYQSTLSFGPVHLYCRVSSIRQSADGTSLDSQEAAGRTWAAVRGLPIASVVREVWSGDDLERPGLKTLIDQTIRPGDMVLAYALDRFSRDETDTIVLVDKIERVGCCFALVTEEFDNNPTGKLVRYVQSCSAANELTKIKERIGRGRRARVAQGKPLGSPKAPYGLRWNEGKTGYVREPIEAPIVRCIFDLALAGTSLRGIAERLNADGVASPAGGMWAASTIRELLRRPVYSGDHVAFAMRYKRRGDGIKGYDKRPGTQDDRVVLPNVLKEPIVTKAEQAAVLERLGFHKRHASRNNANPEAFLLRAGFVTCRHCGYAMAAKNDTRNSSASSYRCVAKSMRLADCPQPSISARELDMRVWEHVAVVLQRPDFIAAEIERRRQSDGLDAELSALDKLVAKTAAKRKKTDEHIVAINDDDVAAPLTVALHDLKRTQSELEVRQVDLARRIANRDAEAATIRELAARCERMVANVDDLSYEQKRLALTWLGVRVFVAATDSELPRWRIEVAPTLPDGIM